jgi:hemoglobin/transferrin/lactoferrin receptor protein
MKRILIVIVAMCSVSAFAQTVTFLNETTLQPIEKVSVAVDEQIYFSDVKGQLEVALILDKPVTISHPDFQQVKTTFTSDGLAGKSYTSYTIYLKQQGFSMEEVVVSANRFAEKRKDVAQQIAVINSNELNHMNQSSTADVMSNQGNVFVQKSQLGGGSPIIRGFETNKVLMVVDGVRMNNAIYRGGHLQNIVTLDNASFDKVEVLFGSGSVIYGSDALGGVMHFYTKNPLLSNNDKLLVKANALTRYHSAANGYTGHVDVSVGKRRFGSLTSFTYSKFDDLKQGANRNPFYPSFGARTFYSERINGIDSMIINKDTNLQVGSGYTQIDVMQKFLFKQSDKVQHSLNFQYSTSSDVPRYDRLTQTSGTNPKYAEWYYGPQNRLLTAYNLQLTNKNLFYDQLRVTAAYQNIEESRIDRRFKKNICNHRIEKLDILSLNVDAEKMIGKQELRYGIEVTNNSVNSTAFKEDISVDTTGKLDTRYPDGGSTMRSIAAYATHTWEISDKLILNDGIRVSNVMLESKFDDKTFFPFPFDNVKQNNTALNGNLGLIYLPGYDFRITVLGSTGFRAPNVDDLSKVFESVQGNVIVPNPNLKPEYTYNAEIGIAKTFNKKVTVSVNGYYTLLKNAITVQPSTFEGSDSIMYDGQLSQVTTTINATEAYIYGLEAGVRGNITNQLSIVSTINYTYGRIKTDTTDYPLDHIPPVFGKTGLNLNVKKFRGEVFVQYSGWKRLKNYNLIGEDNIAYATAQGMPAWFTLNARIGYQFNRYVSLQVACENILDVNYRQFASNISAAGRNFIVTLRGSF